MAKTQNPKKYDLEDRTFKFAKEVIKFSKLIPQNIPNIEIIKQVVRSSGSVGANYIEANESLGRKDFVMRIKICRKESKETIYWLRLLETKNNEDEDKRQSLVQEANELMKIFGAIYEKTKEV